MRVLTCPNFGAHHDRDENASVNILNYKPIINPVKTKKAKLIETKAQSKEDLNQNQNLN